MRESTIGWVAAKAILTTGLKDMQELSEIEGNNMGKYLKFIGFSEKVTFFKIILFIASKLVGVFFLQILTLCAKSYVYESDV